MADLEFCIYFKDTPITDIKICKTYRKADIEITNYTENSNLLTFITDKPKEKEIMTWLETRCFPRSRDNARQLLDDLGLPLYDTLDILKITHGLLFEDYYWIKFKGEEIDYDAIKIRD